MLMHAIVHGGCTDKRESALEVDSRRKIPWRSIAPGFSAIPAPAVTKKMVGNQLMLEKLVVIAENSRPNSRVLN